MYHKLTPETLINTPAGPAAFVQYKPGRFRGRSVQARLQNGQTAWFTEAELKAEEKRLNSL